MIKKKYEKGRINEYYKEISYIPILSEEQERLLGEQIRNKDQRIAKQAENKLIQSNLRLVVTIANGYRRRGLDLEDLIQEGNFGLFRAAKTFDPDKGRFSTYASTWIRQKIRDAIKHQAKVVRIPNYLLEILSKWRQLRDILKHELAREPTWEEISTKLNLSKKKKRLVYICLGQCETVEDSELDVLDIRCENSIHQKIVNKDPTDHAQAQECLEFLKYLSELEQKIVRERFGLNDGIPMFYHDIGKKYKISRERVRKIIDEAIVKLHDMMEIE